MRSKSPRNSGRMLHCCAFVSFFFFFKSCLFLATLGLCWWEGFPLVLARRGEAAPQVRWAGFSLQRLLLLWTQVLGPLDITSCQRCTAAAAALGLQSADSVDAAHGLSSCAAWRMFSDQRSNPCLLPWQADSLPLSHQGGSCLVLLMEHTFRIVSGSL